MVAHLQSQFPRDGVIREEGENILSQSGYTWVLDPIDGTSSFVRGLPIFGTLIGLVNDQMQTVLGVANQPITGDRWQGITGEKSHINGVPIINPYKHQSISLAQACLASTTPLMFTTPEQREKVKRFYQKCQRTAFGGDCLNYLAGAAGWTSMALVILEADMNFYDFCALIPILAGADYYLSDWQGKSLTANSTEILASPNRDLHQQALQLLTSSDLPTFQI
jgi:histidinol phosphatase-like enzyme (inositol monophosphatase family)